jgi:ANTH domain
MRSLQITIATIAFMLCAQRRNGVASAKKPSRPLPSASRPRQTTQAANSRRSGAVVNGRQQRPLSRKPPISNSDEEEDVDEIDSIVGLPDDDDDDDDDNIDDADNGVESNDVTVSRSSKNRNQRSTPPTGQRVPTRPVNGNKQTPLKSRNRPTPAAQYADEDEDDERDEDALDDDNDNDDDEDEDTYVRPRLQQRQQQPRQQRGGRPSPTQQRPAFVGRRKGAQQSPRDARNNRPGTGSATRRPTGGRVVPYSKPTPGNGAAAALAQGWSGLVSALPDPAIVKEAALSSYNAAKQTTSNLSANIYREVKGLTSSELEQVMLKATRPDDTAVKGKHVERLVGVTYQISSRYDIYDAVLRKLWSKMTEPDWRTTIKALYILHRYSADGSPEHAPALKTRLRELRRTRDPKRKDKFFNTKQLLAGETTPDNFKFRAFMGRYANYVLLRTQCFSGMFEEISSVPPTISNGKKKTTVPQKPITSTSLRIENLNAAEMLLKAGIVCQLKDGEICENTAIAAERVASDMIGLTSAVAMALNRVLKDNDDLPKSTDLKLIKQWCLFYSQQLLPNTKAMIKKVSPNLDAFGLFLPSRMGTSVPPNLLEKGLHLVDKDSTSEDEESSDDDGIVEVEAVSPSKTTARAETSPTTSITPTEQEVPLRESAPKTKESMEVADNDRDNEVDDTEKIESEEDEDEEYEYEDEEDDEEYDEDDEDD